MNHQSISSTAVLRDNLYPVAASSSAPAVPRMATGLNDNHSTSLFDLARIAVAQHDERQARDQATAETDENVLALARVGGNGGHVWVYKDASQYQAHLANQSSATFLAASHRQWF
jgi:hypothetical protein